MMGNYHVRFLEGKAPERGLTYSIFVDKKLGTYIRICSKPTPSRLRRISTHKPTLFDFQLLVFNFYLLVFQLPPPTPPYSYGLNK